MWAADPDFGPNVLVFDSSSKDAQQRIHEVFHQQEKAQFGSGRFALMFKPGDYQLDVPVGFYTHVAGLGESPNDVRIHGRVWTDAAWMRRNATCNFWRIAENLTVRPTTPGGNVWAVSQAAPMRRMHIQSDLHLSSGGWSSGGFLADCKIDGVVDAGSQQQWFSRNSQWQQWKGGNWNVVFLGCNNAPTGQWPTPPFTVIPKTPLIREKPFLGVEADGRWVVRVPTVRDQESSGPIWEVPRSLPIEQFHIAKAGIDSGSTMNAAMRSGKHLLITPGIYPLDEPIEILRPGTVVLGIGLPSLCPPPGKPAVLVTASEGSTISGLVMDAGPTESNVLLQIGDPLKPQGNAKNPAVLHDIYCRVGGYGPGKAKLLVAIYDHHVIGDNFWLWRADHGHDVSWTNNTCDTGLLVAGNDVTLYGLFVEHTQKHQTIWNGERGRVYFYQSEMPYDPPSNDAWSSPKGLGYASYVVGEHVTSHQAWGIGVYHFFKAAPVVADCAIEAPEAEGIQLNHLLTYRLSGGKQGSGIRCVVNAHPGQRITQDRTTLDRFIPLTRSNLPLR